MKNFQETIKHWREGALRDFKAAKSLSEKKFYSYCLFFCHLSLEKMLKALVMHRTQQPHLYTHDLRRLAEIARIDSLEDKHDILDDISLFNIAGRYPEQKLEFHKKHNKKEIAERYLKITKNLLLWLKKEFPKK